MDSPLFSRVGLVVNHAARGGAAAAAYVETLVRSVQRATGGDLDVATAGTGDDLPAALDRAAGRRPDLLVVAGGDGTAAAAATRLAGTGMPLGVVPTGATNDVARSLAIPTSAEEAVDVMIGGALVDVDLGVVDGRTFVQGASVGLPVTVAERLRRGQRRPAGRLARGVATAVAHRGHLPFAARLEHPDGDHPTLALAGLLQVRVALVDDGRLRVEALPRCSPSRQLALARRLRDDAEPPPEVHRRTTTRLRLVTTPGLPVEVDGEVVGRTPSRFAVQRAALRVVVPRGAAADVGERRAATHDVG